MKSLVIGSYTVVPPTVNFASMFRVLHRLNSDESRSYSDVLTTLMESKTFAFTVRKEHGQPIRHSSIELQFDGKPRYTVSVDRRISNKTPSTSAVTYIENINDARSENCGIVFQSSNKIQSKAVIDKLLAGGGDMLYNPRDKINGDRVAATVAIAMEGRVWKWTSKQKVFEFIEGVRTENRRRAGLVVVVCIA